MKPYVVIRLLSSITSVSVEDQFDNLNDAQAFADILNRQHAEEGWKYQVFVAVQA